MKDHLMIFLHAHGAELGTALSITSLGVWIVDFCNAIHPVLSVILLAVGIASGVMSMHYMRKYKKPKGE